MHTRRQKSFALSLVVDSCEVVEASVASVSEASLPV